ncbi:MAG: hypothetical protein QOD87_696 [Pseudonocardiales bacterium]|nr:hypothetical protein [Pseudonocardiales bacterium]
MSQDPWVVDVLHAQPGETVAVEAPLISVTARPRGAPDDGFREPGLITPTVSTTEPAVPTGPDAARTGLRSSETSMNSAMCDWSNGSTRTLPNWSPGC